MGGGGGDDDTAQFHVEDAPDSLPQVIVDANQAVLKPFRARLQARDGRRGFSRRHVMDQAHATNIGELKKVIRLLGSLCPCWRFQWRIH